MTEEGQTRVRFTRARDGVKCKGWTSLKTKHGRQLLLKLADDSRD